MELNQSSTMQVALHSGMLNSLEYQENKLPEDFEAFFAELAEENYVRRQVVLRLQELWPTSESLQVLGEVVKNTDDTKIKEAIVLLSKEAGLYSYTYENEILLPVGDRTLLNPRENLTNWITKGMTPSRQGGYLLCFALRMNLNQATEFFHKGMLDRPFNVKDLEEATYYYCLNNDKCYADSVQLLHKIEAITDKREVEESNRTVAIAADLSEIHTDEAYIDYAVNRIRPIKMHNVSAMSKLHEIYHELLGTIRDYNPDFFGGDNDITPNKLLKYFYDAPSNFRSFKPEQLNLPKRITRSMPSRNNFEQLLSGSSHASNEVIRKALIFLNFCLLFIGEMSLVEDEEPYGLSEDFTFEEFERQMNEVLLESGYNKMYWRNPYDCLFAFCAHKEYPFEEFNSIFRLAAETED